MTVSVEADALTDALKRASAGVSTRAHLPILNGARLTAADGTLTITTTCFDVTVTTTVSASGELDCVVPHRRFMDFASRCSGPIGIGMVDGEFVAETQKFDVRLRPYDVHDWPLLPTIEGEAADLDEELVAALQSVLYAAGVDTARPALTGVKISADGAACTDSYRGATVKASFPFDSLVPAAPLASFLDGNPVSVCGDERHVVFQSDRTTTTLRSLLDPYPTWKSLIRAESPITIEVDRGALLDAVESVAPFGSDLKEFSGTAIRMQTVDDRLVVFGQSQDVGEARARVPATGSLPDPVGVRAPFLREMLRGITTETVALQFDPPRPIQVDDGDVTHLLMPVKVGL